MQGKSKSNECQTRGVESSTFFKVAEFFKLLRSGVTQDVDLGLNITDL